MWREKTPSIMKTQNVMVKINPDMLHSNININRQIPQLKNCERGIRLRKQIRRRDA